LDSGPVAGANESLSEKERRICTAYYDWLWTGCAKTQKLALVQLAEEQVANPNNREVISQLIEKGLVSRSRGILTISDYRFGKFLKHVVPVDTVRLWERQGHGIHSSTLHTSLLVAAVGVAAFVYYMQAEVFNTWVTWITGLAAMLPPVLRMFDLLRSGGGSDPQQHEATS
jgi:hypothetical protein